MKLDLFYEFCQGAPRPWYVGADRDLYKQVLEQAAVADAAGFNCFWSVEHHGSVEVTHMPAPECFLTAVSMRTKQLRVGHSVALTPYAFNHPIRLAERAAVLDNLSDGRFEMGFGRSTPREWAIFDVDGDETRPMLQETLEIVPRLWTEDIFSYESERLRIPRMTLVPRVLQQPHPSMWMACGSPDSFAMAGRNGIGAMGLTLFQPLSFLAERLARYREAVRDAEPVGKFLNNRTAAFTFVYCAETEHEAIFDGAPEAAAWYLGKVSAYYGTTATKRDDGAVDFGYKLEDRIQSVEARGESATTDLLIRCLKQEPIDPLEFYETMAAEDQCIIGTPDHVLREMERYADAGLDHLMCMVQGGPSLPHEKIIKSLKLLGEKVLPRFHGDRKVATR